MPDTLNTFRFLDLPTELRLMVYEFLPNRTKRVTFTQTSKQGHTNSFSLITTSTPSTAILATCRLVGEEAKDVLRATAQRYLDGGPFAGPAPRIEADVGGLKVLIDNNGLMKKVIVLYDALKKRTRRQPQRSARDSIMKDVASSIAANGYHPEACATTEGLQELECFARMAAHALLHQKTRIQKGDTQSSPDQQAATVARPPGLPLVEIALRKQSNINDRSFIWALDDSIYRLWEMSGNHTISYVFHLLNDNTTSVDDQRRLFRSMKDHVKRQTHLRHAIIMGQDSFNENSEEVYDALWKGNEQN